MQYSKTIHGLLVHSVFMRKEYGANYLSTSLFELMHSSVAKRAVKMVQALVISEHYASRLLVQTTCNAITSIARDTREYEPRTEEQLKNDQSSWQYLQLAQTSERVQNDIAFTKQDLWNLALENMAANVKERQPEKSFEEAEALAQDMLQRGHEAFSSLAVDDASRHEGRAVPANTMNQPFCYILWSQTYSLSDGANSATSHGGNPSPPLPWLATVRCGDFVVYRMAEGRASKVHAAHVLGWVHCVFQTPIPCVTESALWAIVDFMEPIHRVQSNDSSTTFKYTQIRSRRGDQRWRSILSRGNVWQRLPLCELDDQRSRFLLPTFFQCILNSGADVERVVFE